MRLSNFLERNAWTEFRDEIRKGMRWLAAPVQLPRPNLIPVPRRVRPPDIAKPSSGPPLMGFFRRQPKHHRLSPAGQLLVDDVEAFLAGSYEDYTRRRGCEIPAWSRLNLIAHGDLESIHALEHAEPSGSQANDQYGGAWSGVQRVLARQLLALVGDNPTVLARIQHTFLIPLELRLIKESTSGGLGALEIVEATQRVLRSVS